MPPRMPPLLTVTGPESEPSTSNSPWLTNVGPVYVLLPLAVNVPVPTLIRPPGPEIGPESAAA